MMHEPSFYEALANAVLILHLGTVLFIVGGLVLILLGGRRQWAWVKNFWFRLLHLGAIAYVAGSSLLRVECPLTTLEVWLRERAGQAGYDGDFIVHWLRALLFFEAPQWVFIAVYCAFALLVAISWVGVRPRRP